MQSRFYLSEKYAAACISGSYENDFEPVNAGTYMFSSVVSFQGVTKGDCAKNCIQLQNTICTGKIAQRENDDILSMHWKRELLDFQNWCKKFCKNIYLKVYVMYIFFISYGQSQNVTASSIANT